MDKAWTRFSQFLKSTSVVMAAGNMSFVEAIMVCFFLPRVRNAIMNFWLDSISSPELSLDKGNEDSGDEVGLDLVSEVPDKIPLPWFPVDKLGKPVDNLLANQWIQLFCSYKFSWHASVRCGKMQNCKLPNESQNDLNRLKTPSLQYFQALLISK